jgi:exopolysaccharide biosynthesis polyprenyl glycosylphosphotransferase
MKSILSVLQIKMEKLQSNRLKRHKIRTIAILLLDVLDFVTIGATFGLSITIAASYDAFDRAWTIQQALFLVIVFLSWGFLLRLANYPRIPRTTRRLAIVFEFFQLGFLNYLFLVGVKIIFGFIAITFLQLSLFSILNLVALLSIRIITFGVFKYYRLRGFNLHYVIVYADSFSEVFIERLLRQKEWGFKILLVVSESKLIRAKFSNQLKILPSKLNLKSLLEYFIIDEVIYCKGTLDCEEVKKISDICTEIGVIFRLQSELSPLNSDVKIVTSPQQPELLFIHTPTNKLATILKEMMDFYVSGMLIILFAPVMLIVSLVVFMESGGPVIFRQERVGLRGRRFTMYKFRTMVKNAESIRQHIDNLNESDGPVFKIKNDPRITRVGRILRKTGLDELPQFFNVFLGQMSLIGPRPPIPSEVAQYEFWQLRRLSVKPGITCTWQVMPNRNNIRFETWMKLDLGYIDKWSLRRDIHLLLKTVKTMLNRTGS